MDINEVAQVLLELKQAGLVRHFGVSNFGWPQLQLLQSALPEPLLVNQLEMSLAKTDWLEQNVLTGMEQGAGHFFSYGTVEYCQQHQSNSGLGAVWHRGYLAVACQHKLKQSARPPI